mmetsp:Transcript_24314/g.68342  ORF Transcript_24314/g.68342 Transcript_24314/m.68342 type:complete len:151 (+) Transcript_24314:175-627(+)
MSIPNPLSLVKGNGNKEELPVVEQIGTISLTELNTYHCNNPKRRLLSLFGTIYDVTSSEKSYGKDGAYKEYAGHDITLAIGLMKTDEKWLDRFVKMEDKWVKDAEGWVEYMASKYPECGKLDKWDEEGAPDAWPELSDEEKKELEQCVIM